MIAARLPIHRPTEAKLLVVDPNGRIRHWKRSKFVDLFRPGDLVVANDAATLPASLSGQHLPSGRLIEVRLAGRHSLSADDICRFSAVLFGAGDFRMRTEDRPLPPTVAPGDWLALGPLHAKVEKVLHHPRLVSLWFEGSPDEIREGLSRHGRPIQYSHVPTPLALWDVWTSVAFEPPSAGFVLDWQTLASIRARGIQFVTITHAAGISSTGDPELDALLPFDEPYLIPESTALAISHTQKRHGRITAIGTTVVRALEHAAAFDGVVRASEGLATQRISAASRLRVVDAILSGTHEPGTSHHDLLGAFTDGATLCRVDQELDACGYRSHEFGDSVFIERKGQKLKIGSLQSRSVRGSARSTRWNALRARFWL
jgi:S-adenosylmethionine:tRNA ribosyltransferase-isomerase